MKIKKEDIVGIECRHALHIPANYEQGTRDMHFVKEQVHLKDGSIVPRVRLIPDFKVDYYVTKEPYRDHKQKKDYEKLEKLSKFSSTVSELPSSVHAALGRYGKPSDLMHLKESPYLYGLDISSANLLKTKCKEKYASVIPNPTKNTLAVLDLETDVVDVEEDDEDDYVQAGGKRKEKFGKIIMGSLYMMSKLLVVVTRKFVEDIPNPVQAIRKQINESLKDYIAFRNMKVNIVIVNSEYGVLEKLFKQAHAWKPDYLGIWNISFEMERFFDASKREGFSLIDLMSDPDIPPQYRKLRWTPGKPTRRTVSGKFTPVRPHNQWPTVDLTASFKMVDLMCLYRQLRSSEQELPEYNLDYILQLNAEGKNLPFDLKKLKPEGTENYFGLDWHFVMQTKHKLKYIAYNGMDCIGPLELDELTGDVSATLEIKLSGSEINILGSKPRLLVEFFNKFSLTQGYAMGCHAKNVKDAIDDLTLPLSGWIIALQAHKVADNGVKVIVELANLTTNVRIFVADLDVSSSYPKGQEALNISKTTCLSEIIGIAGFDTYTMRMQGMNLTGGHVNAIEFCTIMLDAATPLELLSLFEKQKELPKEKSIQGTIPKEPFLISMREIDALDDEEDEANPLVKVERMKENGVEVESEENFI